MTDDTANELEEAERVFEVLLDTLVFTDEDSEFRIFMVDRRGKKVPMLVFVNKDEAGVTGIVPLAELITDPYEDGTKVLSYTGPYAILYPNREEDECPEKTLELSPESFMITNNGRKH